MKKQIIAVGLLLITFCAQAQVITTVAGNGTSAGYAGDGGPATMAKLNMPISVCVDGTGVQYIADFYNNRIRKVDATGTITTFAGSTLGFSGDGGPATAAQLYQPNEVKTDAAGNVYVIDNGRIRKINTLGIISTVACNGTYGYTGDGGPATAAEIALGGMAIDGSGNIFIGAHTRIRKVSISGIISTVAGTGVAGFSGDGGPATAAQFGAGIGGASRLAFDAAGNLYIVDDARIRKINTTGIISTIAGTGVAGYSGDGGPATAAQIEPISIATDGGSTIYVVDINHRIRKINSTGIISTCAGTGTVGYSGDSGAATAAQLDHPTDVALDVAGNLYISDQYNNVIRKVTTGTTSVIEANKTDISMHIYSNPMKESFVMQVTSPNMSDARILIMNATGAKVKEACIPTNTIVNIPFGEPAGTYFVIARIGSWQSCERVVK